MKIFLFQGDSITDANRDDESVDNFSLGCGYAFLLASDIEKNKKGEVKFINRGKSGDRITDVYARIKEEKGLDLIKSITSGDGHIWTVPYYQATLSNLKN